MLKIFTHFFISKRIAASAMPLTIGIVILLLVQQSAAQTLLNVWYSNGPNTNINAIVVDPFNPRVIYAGSDSGVFKSVNNGASWFMVNQMGVSDLETDSVNPNTIYAGTVSGVFKSTDGGLNWSPINSPVADVTRLEVASSNPNFIYAATQTNILVTTNGGASWNTRQLPVAYEYLNLLEVDPQNPNVIYTFVGDYDFLIDLFKSIDGGLTWTQLSYGGGYHVATTALKIDPANPEIIYAATYFGVYKSTNGGASWTLHATPCAPGVPCGPPTALFLAIDPLAAGSLYTTRYNGNDYSAYKSTNDGVTWSLFNNGYPGVSVNDLVFDRTGRFLHAATPLGVYSVRVREEISNANRTADFDGDGRTDISVFRPSVGEWWYQQSSNGTVSAAQFGVSGDRLTPADFTGDGRTDIAFFRPVSGEWFVLRSEDAGYYSYPFGTNGDIPQVGDFDADGKADTAVFRPSDFTWYIRRSSDGGTIIQQFGQAGDLPVAADYDGDGKSDIAIYRVSSGEWWINRSTAGLIVFQFGNSSDKPTPGDFTGDGKADAALFRPSTGEWFVLRSENQTYYSFPFGLSTDLPAPGDYDGDGKVDAAIFRPSNSTWYINQTTSGIGIVPFGITGDQPVPNTFVP